MPCRVSYDVHEWIHEDPAVPAYNPVNPPAGRTVQRLPVGQEDPVELTAVSRWGEVTFAERMWEPMNTDLRVRRRQQWNTTHLRPPPLPRPCSPEQRLMGSSAGAAPP